LAAIHLLQLVLGCAVNCEAKETYIEAIMGMEESVQQSLMEAIQLLMKAVDQCKTLLTENAHLAQKCHELELELASLRDEKQLLQSENKKLRAEASVDHVNPDPVTGASLLGTSSISGDPVVTSLSPTVANVRIGQLQDQVSKLRSEVYRLETGKEEMEMKLTHAMSMNQELKQKCDQLAQRAEEAAHLKDELDIAREELATSAHLTAQMEQLRKRADEAVELRVRCAKLTEDNRVCVERLRELEQETRFSGNLRSQAETQRMQAADARLEATEATRRAEALDSELRKVREELTGTVREKMLLVTELNRLRACCEELQMCVNPTRGVEEEIVSLSSDANVQLSPAIQSQMMNLQEELSRLKTSLSTVEGHTCCVTDAVEPSPTHVHQGFQTETAHEPISHKIGVSPVPVQNGLPEETESVQSVDRELSSLRNQLSQKEQEMTAMEQKYRGYLWKAREVIRVLEREHRRLRDNSQSIHVPAGTTEPAAQEIDRLRSLLVEKEDIIEKLEVCAARPRSHIYFDVCQMLTITIGKTSQTRTLLLRYVTPTFVVGRLVFFVVRAQELYDACIVSD
uniref:CRCM protein n=1 Tax=Echinostoma caproni TaxID=27848 RepID=A0A183AI68_9TREM